MTALFEFKEGLLVAFDALRANKLRALLTTLGIVIGILTVTLMSAAIQGLNRAFLQSISTMGADVLHVSQFSWFTRSNTDWVKQQNRQIITVAQVREVERQMTLARAVAPYVDWSAQVSYKKRSSARAHIIGTTEQFVFTGGMTVADGRFFSAAESDGARPVCVIGAKVVTNLFQGQSPLGETIRLGPYNFEVVGTLAVQGNFMGEFSLDNFIVLPVKQIVANFGNNPRCTIQVKASDPARLDETKEELRGVFRKIRRVPPTEEDDFSINQQETLVGTFNRVAGTIAAVGLFITGLSLFVGGIGIMNIMFVSVAERTREIGIRKAIGAKRRAILLQFLIEASGICLFGGLIGVALAWPITLLMQKALPAQMSWPSVAIALAVALVTGVVSGFLPAWRAARMNPVDALRNE